MMPTLKDGERVIAKKIHNTYREDLINKIIIFYFPYKGYSSRIEADKERFMIKRCIGTPGDTVSIKKGQIYNKRYGRIVACNPDTTIERHHPSFYMAFTNNENHKSDDILNISSVYIPAKGETIEIDYKNMQLYRNIIKYEMGEKYLPGNHYTFKEDYFLVCGDNMTFSQDSRYWGFLPGKFITHYTERP